MYTIGRNIHCRACESTTLKPFFDLGAHPLANSLLEKFDADEKRYPLKLERCGMCGLIQLGYTVDPKILFSRYVWVTGTSRGAKDFSEVFKEALISRTPNAKLGYALEVASNDGTFLVPFQRDGYAVVGVDPAENIVEIAQKRGVSTICAFWNFENAKKIKGHYGPAKMLIVRNVLAHVADTADFVHGLAECLDNSGVLAVEVHYAGEILNGLQYDSIYHEHLCYFTLKPLEHLLRRFGLFTFDIFPSPISGGGIVVYASKAQRAESESLKAYRRYEEEKRINELETWNLFTEQCFAHKEKLRTLIKSIVDSRRSIVGWGASARSSTMLNFCDIGAELLPLIVDMNPLKHGKYTAGKHVLIISAEEGMKRRPDAIFITGWNFEEEIKSTARKTFGFKGEFLVPLPSKSRIVS